MAKWPEKVIREARNGLATSEIETTSCTIAQEDAEALRRQRDPLANK